MGREKVPYCVAQVAELVDALVSKTNEVTLVPVRSRPRVQKKSCEISQDFFYFSSTDVLFESANLKPNEEFLKSGV